MTRAGRLSVRTPDRLPAVAAGSTRAAVTERPAAPAGSFPTLRRVFDWRGPYLIPLVLLLGARAAMWVLIPVASEDAYISFRYARNLAVGNGLVYNPGERVLGFTSPLWTLWCALGLRLFHDPIAWSRGWAIAADTLTLLGLGGLLEHHDPAALKRAVASPGGMTEAGLNALEERKIQETLNAAVDASLERVRK